MMIGGIHSICFHPCNGSRRNGRHRAAAQHVRQVMVRGMLVGKSKVRRIADLDVELDAMA